VKEVSLPGSRISVVTSNLDGCPNVMHSIFVVLASPTSSDSEAALGSVTSLGQKHLYSEHTARMLVILLNNQLAIQLAFLICYNKDQSHCILHMLLRMQIRFLGQEQISVLTKREELL